MLAPAGAVTGHGEPGFSAFERAVRRLSASTCQICSAETCIELYRHLGQG